MRGRGRAARGEEGEGMTGIEMIAAERARQIAVEGWTPAHDGEHVRNELVQAAICYAACVLSIGDEIPVWINGQQGRAAPLWPKTWAPSWDKRREHIARGGPVRALAIAGALIAAEIDRLERAAKKGKA
jgi:hypothetical protein